MAGSKSDRPVFDLRIVYECGWNVFIRRGFSENQSDIHVNYTYLDHLSAAGINWLVVFWANASSFDQAWNELVPYAHARGIKLARGVYAYSGGGPSYLMAEPDAPGHLLRSSPKGPDTALCPHEKAAQEWMEQIIRSRLEPDLDGIVIEPARMISRHCTCSRCAALHPYEWDTFVLNPLLEVVAKAKPEAEAWPYVFIDGGLQGIPTMAERYRRLREQNRFIFAWGADDPDTLQAWLGADPRFHAFTKLGRVLLFPGGKPPVRSVQERVASLFEWCRTVAEHGKSGFMLDYRIFGGREWQGHSDEVPVTRISERIPASLAVIGAALRNPHLDKEGQRAVLEEIRHFADWDLDDPRYFYRGERSEQG